VLCCVASVQDELSHTMGGVLQLQCVAVAVCCSCSVLQLKCIVVVACCSCSVWQLQGVAQISVL